MPNLHSEIDTQLLALDLDRTRPVLLGFSGGADSLCLGLALKSAGWQVLAAHFEHRLRQDSDLEQTKVVALAGAVGLYALTGRANVARSAAQTGESIEATGRELRYQFLFAQAVEHDCQAVLTAHQADDQIETVLMHLLRGAGTRGLAGMAMHQIMPGWHPHIPLVRPLLGIPRREIKTFLNAQPHEPVEDPSNQVLGYFRNRIRHQLVPVIKQLAPNAGAAILRTTVILSAEESLLKQLTAAAWRETLLDQGTDWLILDRTRYDMLALAIQRRLIMRAARQLVPQHTNLDLAAIERVCTAVQTAVGQQQIDLSDGLIAEVNLGQIAVLKRSAQLPLRDWPQLEGLEAELRLPGELKLNSRWFITAKSSPEQSELSDAWSCNIPVEVAAELLRFRTRLPGDRVRFAAGRTGRQKVSDLMINKKIPTRARAAWPVLVMADEVIWVPGLRAMQFDPPVQPELGWIEVSCRYGD